MSNLTFHGQNRQEKKNYYICTLVFANIAFYAASQSSYLHMKRLKKKHSLPFFVTCELTIQDVRA